MASSVPTQYASEVQRAFGVWAAWPPEQHFPIGTIGRIINNLFEPESSIKDFGHTVTALTSAATSTRHYATEGAVTFTVEPTASVSDSRTVANISFQRASAVFLALTACQNVRVASPLDLLAAVRALAAEGKWDPEWHIVTETTEATSGVIAASKSAGATLQISFDVGSPNQQSSTLGAFATSIQIGATKSIAYQTVVTGKITPLFGLKRLVIERGQTALRGSHDRESTISTYLLDAVPELA